MARATLRGKRHPSRMQLQAWFDGEAVDGIGWHLASCESCFAHVEELARLRNVLRLAFADVGDAAGVADDAALALDPDFDASDFDMTSEPPSEVSRYLVGRARWRARALVAVPVAVLVVAGLVLGVAQGPFHGTLSSAPGPLSGSTTGPAGFGSGDDPISGLFRGSTVGSAGGSAAPRTAASSGRSGSGSAVGLGVAGVGPLSLAVIVPTQGTDAAQGSQVVEAVREAVHEANTSGGVAGAPVQLTLVSAEDPAAVAALAGRVTAVAGGFDAAAPDGVPWILPADPWAGGASTVATELSPAQAGVRLGQNLVQQGHGGTVGVVMGTGPDTALETGLAQVVPVTTVAAPSSGACVPAAASLESQGVTAIAVAGSPALAASCAAALGTMGWSPPNGMLLAPSAAYQGVGGFGLVPTTTLYTVLGLPWPEGTSPGAARFRSAVPGASSYRALVSYAAVEMAVQAAREGALNMALLSGGVWRNDLYDFAGISNVGATVVESKAGVWSPAP